MLRKVISGAQTGADRAGLIAAKRFGFETGGHMPKGFLALDGYHPEYADLYGIQETPEADYPARTRLNVRNAQATIRVAIDFASNGEKCTMKWIEAQARPYMDLQVWHDPKAVPEWRIAGIYVGFGSGGIEGGGEPRRLADVQNQQTIIDWIGQWDVLNVAGNSHLIHASFQLWCLTILSAAFRRVRAGQNRP